MIKKLIITNTNNFFIALLFNGYLLLIEILCHILFEVNTI